MIPLPKSCSSTYRMSAKLYLNLLVLYGVLCQGILGTLSEKENDESLELLDRQKRVVNRDPVGDIRQSIRNVPYVVFIRQIRRENHCVGTVLSSHIIITVAACVELRNDVYRVYSGTSRLVLNGPYKIHQIIDKQTLHGIHPYRNDDGISLLAVYPPIDFTSSNVRSTFLYEGVIHPGTHAIASGWGCDQGGDPGTAHPQHLRSISVPIISTEQCEHLYRGAFAITNADICTLDPTGNQYCSVNDAGAPLVVEENRVKYLIGIHLWNGGIVGRINPDVFVNLQNPRYKFWILENKRSMEAYVQNYNPHNHG